MELLQRPWSFCSGQRTIWSGHGAFAAAKGLLAAAMELLKRPWSFWHGQRAISSNKRAFSNCQRPFGSGHLFFSSCTCVYLTNCLWKEETSGLTSTNWTSPENQCWGSVSFLKRFRIHGSVSRITDLGGRNEKNPKHWKTHFFWLTCPSLEASRGHLTPKVCK